MIGRRFTIFAALGIALSQAAGCSPGYLTQAAMGQIEIARARRPVAELLADEGTAPELRRKLSGAQAALEFAHTELSLPDNGSYREFAEIDRAFVVWNVFAAPEFALQLRTWCFPVAGCVGYRGYFAESKARQFAGRESGRGHDVAVIGASAFSTLGYFRDPLLSSVTRLPESTVVGMIFHELAHQRLYVPGDTVFNESFATLVEQEGLIRWLGNRGDRDGLCRYLRGLEREREVHRLLNATRGRLAAIYASRAPVEARRAAKVAEIGRLRENFREMRQAWREPPFFDSWFDGAINNATLGALAAYQDQVGTLRVILNSEGGDLQAFYHRAERLGRLQPGDRAMVLREITSPTDRRPGAECRDGSG